MHFADFVGAIHQQTFTHLAKIAHAFAILPNVKCHGLIVLAYPGITEGGDRRQSI